MTDYAKIAAAVRRDACEDCPDKCRTCGARKNCGSIRIHKAADAIDQLVQIHQLDLSELVRLRRQIQALLEERSAEHCSAEEA